VGKKHIEIPGPGEYTPRLSVCNVSLGNIGSTSRDLAALPRSVAPGPGQYDTHGTTMHLMTYNVSGPEAARRAQALSNSLQGNYQMLEPPNIGGGAGGGITGTRSRLGQCSGGSGVNAAAVDVAVRERGSKVKQDGSGSQSQSGTSSPKRTTSPKGARISASEEAFYLSPTTKDIVGTTFVTEPIGLAKGWTLGKANSPVPQATSQPEEQGEQQEQQQRQLTTDQPVPEAVMENGEHRRELVAEEEQDRAVDDCMETANIDESNVVTSTGDTVEVDKVDSVEAVFATDTETVVVAVETSE